MAESITPKVLADITTLSWSLTRIRFSIQTSLVPCAKRKRSDKKMCGKKMNVIEELELVTGSQGKEVAHGESSWTHLAGRVCPSGEIAISVVQVGFGKSDTNN